MKEDAVNIKYNVDDKYKFKLKYINVKLYVIGRIFST